MKMSLMRGLCAAFVLGLFSVGLVASPAGASTIITGSCTDGGGIVWQTQVKWGNTYVNSAGQTMILIDFAGWTTNRAATATDSIVRSYGPDGTVLQTLTRTATFDYRSGAAYDFRNPMNPPSSPGKSKITITVGRDGDGYGNCTVTYLQPATTADPIIAAAGDLVCAPGYYVTRTRCQHKAVSNSILASRPAAFLALGDNQYESGSLSEFKSMYEPSYGRFKASTRPAPGNEDYGTTNASGYYSYFGSLAGDPSKGYRSFDIDDWHIVQLNSERDVSASGAQVAWLKNDLANTTKRCVLAYIHKPRWGRVPNPSLQPIWSALVDGGVTLMLAGHDHDYQAHPKRNASGAVSSTGVAEIVVGTGGRSVNPKSWPNDNPPLAFGSDTFGWLRIRLRSTSADLQFVPVVGSFSDSRTITCNS
jgi:hypothetical protein